MFELNVISFFSGAHFLKGYKGKCEALHGHNWKVEVIAQKQDLDEQGLVLDFKELKVMVESVLDELDHKNLNEIDFFKRNNPSSENIARFIYERIAVLLKPRNCSLKRVVVWEQRDYSASYYE